MPPSWFHGDFLAFGVECLLSDGVSHSHDFSLPVLECQHAWCSLPCAPVARQCCSLPGVGFPSVSQGYGVSLAVPSLCVLKASFLITCQATPAFSPPPTPDFHSLSFVMLLRFKCSPGLDAEAKVVKGGRERIYSFNYRDSLNKTNKQKTIYHCSSPTILSRQRWFSSFSQRQIFQSFYSNFNMSFRMCDCTKCAGVFSTGIPVLFATVFALTQAHSPQEALTVERRQISSWRKRK